MATEVVRLVALAVTGAAAPTATVAGVPVGAMTATWSAGAIDPTLMLFVVTVLASTAICVETSGVSILFESIVEGSVPKTCIKRHQSVDRVLSGWKCHYICFLCCKYVKKLRPNASASILHGIL